MGLLKKIENLQKETIISPKLKEIDGKKYYSTKELSELTGKSIGSISMKLTRDKTIGILINHFRYFSQEDIEKLKGTKCTLIRGTKNIKPKQKKQMFWKISEYNNDLGTYVVKICSLTEEKAKFLETVWIEQGRYVRATPHITSRL